MTQVITIKPDGSLVGLDHKKKGLDLRKLGKARIERVTLIEWDETSQRWFIRWEGRMANAVWTEETFEKAGVDADEFGGSLRYDELLGDDSTVYFHEYEEAVAAEVAVIQAMQLNGESKEVLG